MFCFSCNDEVLKTAKNGHILCFEFSLVSWKPQIINIAASNGRLHFLKYLQIFYPHKFLNSIDPLKSAIENNHFHCFQFLHQQGYPLTLTSTNSAIKKGNIDCLKYIYENHGEINKTSFIQAITFQQLDCLKFLFSLNLQIDTRFFIEYSAENGNLEILKFLYLKGCKISSLVPVLAARKGKLNILMFLFEIGFSFEWKVVCSAAEYGHLDCLKFAYQKFHEQQSSIFSLAVMNKHISCIEFLAKHNFKKIDQTKLKLIEEHDNDYFQCIMEILNNF